MAVTSPAAPSRPPAPRPAAKAPWPGFYYGYWIAGGTFVAQLISVGMMLSIVGPFVTPMTEDLGWSRTEFFSAQTISRFVSAIVGFAIGTRLDRYGPRRFMTVGLVFLGASLFLAGSITELWQWMLLRGVIFTIGGSLTGGLILYVTMSKWWVTGRGRMIGYSSMGVSLAGMTFPSIATFLIAEWGWQTAWRVLAGIAVCAIAPVILLTRRQPEDYGWHPDGLNAEQAASTQGEVARGDFDNSFTRREALHTSTLYLIVLAFGFGGAGITVMQTQSIPFLTDSGFSETFAAMMAFSISLPAMLSKPFWGWTTGHVQPKNAAVIGFLQAGFGLSVVVFAAGEGMRPLLVFGYAMLGFGIGGQLPLEETIWASYFGRRYLGSVRSAALPFSIAFGASSPLIVAYYRDVVGDYTGVFFGIAGCWALAALVVWFVRAPRRRTPCEPAPT